MRVPMEPVEYRESWRFLLGLKLSPLLLVGLGVATSVVCWPIGPGVAVGAIVAAFGLYLLASCLMQPKPYRPGLRLDASGVHQVGSFGIKRIDLPWAAITGVRAAPYRKVGLVVLDVADLDSTSASAAWMRSEASVRIRVALGSPFVLAPRLYGLTPEALRDAIERYRSSLA